jgi:hypothetical protein
MKRGGQNASNFINVNKTDGFEHVFHNTALKSFTCALAVLLHVNSKTLQDAKRSPNMTFVRRQDCKPANSGRSTTKQGPACSR